MTGFISAVQELQEKMEGYIRKWHSQHITKHAKSNSNSYQQAFEIFIYKRSID